MQENKILILDDDASIRLSLMCFFEDRGWEIASAESGEEALDLLSTERPVAAVVDIRLPGMSGEHFIRQAIALQLGLVYVVCTGSSEYVLPPDLAQHPLVSGAVFAKPVLDLSLIEADIQRMLCQCAARKQEG